MALFQRAVASSILAALGRDPDHFVRRGYLIASLSVFDARNFGTFIALIWIVAPVRGFLPMRPARVFASKIPRPAIETSSPRFTVSVMAAIIASTARSASALVQSMVLATFSTISTLLAIYFV